MRNSSCIERFLQKRAEVVRGLSQHIQEVTDHAPAGVPAVQAASCPLMECIPQRSTHLLRVLGSDSTKEFCTSVDETVLKAAKRILDLARLAKRRVGGMIAAEAPTKKQKDSDPRTLALEDLMRENDALSAAFDVEASDMQRLTPADLTLGGLLRGQSRIQRVVSAVATRNHRETCEPYARAWMDGASSSDEDEAETAPGGSAFVQALPVGPTSTLHDTHSKIATRLRLMVPLCAHETRCACAPTSTGAMCGTSMEPLAHHALLCSRAQMSWRHDVIAETWQAAHLKQKAAQFPTGDYRRISDVFCRGVAGDLPHLDVVVTSSIHNHALEWQVASEGVAVAREERPKPREWGYDEILGCTARHWRSKAKDAGARAQSTNWNVWQD